MSQENNSRKIYGPAIILIIVTLFPIICLESYFLYRYNKQNKHEKRLRQLYQRVLQLADSDHNPNNGISLQDKIKAHEAIGLTLQPASYSYRL